MLISHGGRVYAIKGGKFQSSVLSGKTPGRVLNLKKKNPGRVLSRGGFFQLLHRESSALLEQPVGKYYVRIDKGGGNYGV